MSTPTALPKDALQESPAALAVADHYRSLCARTITVPEWGTPGAPLVIHYDPLTVAERDKIRRRADGIDDTGTLEYLVRVIILKAKDPDGRPLFKNVDRHILLTQADERIVRRVADALLGETDPDALQVLQGLAAPEGIGILALYDIAAVLNRTIDQVRQLPESELKGWIAWLRIRGRI